MRNSNEFVTPFWKDALASLPEAVQYRYSLQLHAAERWELAFGNLIELLSRAWAGVGRLFHTPSSAH
jgi:hypothetical protein